MEHHVITNVIPKLDEKLDPDIKKILEYLQYADEEGAESEIFKKSMEKACKIEGKKIQEHREILSLEVYAALLEQKYIGSARK